jgi:hypothetical protein
MRMCWLIVIAFPGRLRFGRPWMVWVDRRLAVSQALFHGSAVFTRPSHVNDKPAKNSWLQESGKADRNDPASFRRRHNA